MLPVASKNDNRIGFIVKIVLGYYKITPFCSYCKLNWQLLSLKLAKYLYLCVYVKLLNYTIIWNTCYFGSYRWLLL